MTIVWRGSTETDLTMAANGHTATVHYAIEIFSDGFESGDTANWSNGPIPWLQGQLAHRTGRRDPA